AWLRVWLIRCMPIDLGTTKNASFVSDAFGQLQKFPSRVKALDIEC
ncbi:2063_t:CDS:2, partial [Acaulospora morrowiae]